MSHSNSPGAGRPTGIKKIFWETVCIFPGGKRLQVKWQNRRARAKFSQYGDTRGVFTAHYQDNFWGSDESRSGLGSTLTHTEPIRRELPKVMTQYNVQRFLDAPCGDFNWMKELDMPPEVHYIGGDIVEPMIEQNQQRYASEKREFMVLDITSDPLPPADMWLCRDCLLHLSHEDVHKALKNFCQSEVKYLLTSTHHACQENFDIVSGHFRQLNLEIAPYNLPPAEAYIKDYFEDGKVVRSLGLWSRETIARTLGF